MSIAYLLVLLGVVLLGVAVWALFWAVDSGQFDELEAQGRAILADAEDLPAGGPQDPSGTGATKD